MRWIWKEQPSLKHRSSGSLQTPDPLFMGAGRELQAQLRQRLSRVEHFRMYTPDASPRGRQRSVSSGGSLAGEEAEDSLPSDANKDNKKDGTSKQQSRRGGGVFGWPVLLAAIAGAATATAVGFWQAGWRSEATPGTASSATDAGELFETLYGRKLDGIAASVASLRGLSEVVTKADDTYDEVYHNQLVQSSRTPTSADEEEWNSFVLDARRTGPEFLAGKEKLRDAVVNLHRLIRRAPDFIKHMMIGLSKQDSEEASWFLRKVVALAESVHGSMEAAAEKFAAVDVEMDGMTRDARENEEHLEDKALRLTDEAQALEISPPVRVGSWARRTDQALWGCILEKSGLSLEGCKEACLSHPSEACDRLTYYKTAVRHRCYLHCGSATEGTFAEADTFLLQRAPEQLVADVAQKRRAGQAASRLQHRWRSVRGPLREVTSLVRHFRTATAELRKGLEEVRFAADDLRAAFEASELSGSGGLDLRQLERRMGDVLSAVEDLGHTLAPMSGQSKS
eukprot:TRINITY_DN110529_c0_g1_i1.p1 TRINITY_DN110529_c0_g1~~TRINITY_DN110529_c0_g1_i1.p1  ORF type:complete len:510 (-),score=139.73 TRINITY_DN110529_c0_g1_i1:79-1608(-)